MSKSMSREHLSKIIFDNSLETFGKLEGLLVALKELNRYSMKGWTNGIPFFEFFRKGGLHNMMECFNWLGENLDKTTNDETLKIHGYLLDKCCT